MDEAALNMLLDHPKYRAFKRKKMIRGIGGLFLSCIFLFFTVHNIITEGFNTTIFPLLLFALIPGAFCMLAIHDALNPPVVCTFGTIENITIRERSDHRAGSIRTRYKRYEEYTVSTKDGESYRAEYIDMFLSDTDVSHNIGDKVLLFCPHIGEGYILEI